MFDNALYEKSLLMSARYLTVDKTDSTNFTIIQNMFFNGYTQAFDIRRACNSDYYIRVVFMLNDNAYVFTTYDIESTAFKNFWKYKLAKHHCPNRSVSRMEIMMRASGVEIVSKRSGLAYAVKNRFGNCAIIEFPPQKITDDMLIGMIRRSVSNENT